MRERPCSKITLPYTFSCKAFQTKEYDICSHCARILDIRTNITKIAFIENKPEEEILRELYYFELPLHAEGE